MVVSFNFFSEFFLSVGCSFPHLSLVAECYGSGLAYHDCERTFDLFDKWAVKINLLKECVVEVEKKLVAKKEELKANKVQLVAKVKELKKARTEVRQLGGELTRLREEVWC